MEATKGASSSSPLHVVVFPWLAFGHLIPFLELAEQLARRGHAVTFLSTSRNIARLSPVPSDLSDRLRLVSFLRPDVDGLPAGAESTADVPPEKVELLKKAFDCLAAPFADFLAAGFAAGDGGEEGFRKKPDWIIIDFAHNWLPPIADEHKVPCAYFSIFSAAAPAYYGPKAANDVHPRKAEDFMAPPKWIPLPSPLAHRRHEAEWIVAAHRPDASGVSSFDRLNQVYDRSLLVIYRSCPEVEGQYCNLLSDLYGKPVVPAGLLLPSDATNDGDNRGAAPDLIPWLDEQPARSVVYVALGSEAPLTLVDIHELALGLELAGASFLWALRRPSGHAGELLPDGFEPRVAGRGVVCTGWVPQMRVLAHGAVGAFLTHCGWGSTVESLRFGHPLVMLPFIADQGLIARVMADRGIGVEVPRDDDGRFTRDGVAAAVRRVMAEEEGKALARKAQELQEALGDQARRDESYVDELVQCLQRCKLC